MSKFKVYDVQFTNEAAFRAALEDVCAEMGKEFEASAANDLHLIGYKGDTRAETAKYVIRRHYLNFASNDMGFSVEVDGIHPIISEFDSYESRVAMQVLNRVKARYAYHDTVDLAYQNGYSVIESVLPDGTVELTLERYY